MSNSLSFLLKDSKPAAGLRNETRVDSDLPLAALSDDSDAEAVLADCVNSTELIAPMTEGAPEIRHCCDAGFIWEEGRSCSG